MPLLEARLTQAIKIAIDQAQANALNDEDPRQQLANGIAQAVINEIKQATITIVANTTTAGLPVAVVSIIIT